AQGHRAPFGGSGQGEHPLGCCAEPGLIGEGGRGHPDILDERRCDGASVAAPAVVLAEHAAKLFALLGRHAMPITAGLALAPPVAGSALRGVIPPSVLERLAAKRAPQLLALFLVEPR